LRGGDGSHDRAGEGAPVAWLTSQKGRSAQERKDRREERDHTMGTGAWLEDNFISGIFSYSLFSFAPFHLYVSYSLFSFAPFHHYVYILFLSSTYASEILSYSLFLCTLPPLLRSARYRKGRDGPTERRLSHETVVFLFFLVVEDIVPDQKYIIGHLMKYKKATDWTKYEQPKIAS
jgi:hypothetical protein